MANKQQPNGKLEADIEIKVEPTSNEFEDDDNQDGFPGFDNVNTIPSTADIGTLNLWTSHATSCLISQYKKYHSMVGQTTRIRSFREMFETISLEMQKFGFYFSPQKCENKWRVLERKYKNLVFRERLKKPGRIRHYGHWEHKRALDEIFNEKKRHMYLDECDFPPPSGSAKFAEKSIWDATVNSRTGQTGEENLSNASSGSQKKDANNQKASLAFFETFLMEMNKNFAQAESNRERRHKEEMAIRQSELEVQKKILKLKERKMELKMNQMTAAAQYFHLNMD